MAAGTKYYVLLATASPIPKLMAGGVGSTGGTRLICWRFLPNDEVPSSQASSDARLNIAKVQVVHPLPSFLLSRGSSLITLRGCRWARSGAPRALLALETWVQLNEPNMVVPCPCKMEARIDHQSGTYSHESGTAEHRARVAAFCFFPASILGIAMPFLSASWFELESCQMSGAPSRASAERG